VLETAYLYRSIQLYHFVIPMFYFLCDMLFTEINAAAAAVIYRIKIGRI